MNEQEDDTGVAEVKVAMPFTLKKQLVTDWENVTQEPRRLVKLPRELTAADVMKQYMESKANRSTPQQTARAQELMDGVRIYFDKVRPAAGRDAAGIDPSSASAGNSGGNPVVQIIVSHRRFEGDVVAPLLPPSLRCPLLLSARS